MKQTKFSEWVADRHPEFQKLDEAWPFSTAGEDKLRTVVSRDRRAMRDNPAPRAISSEKNIQGIATEFMASVADAVRSQQAQPDAIIAAAEAAAGAALSPRAARELFLTAGTRGGAAALQTVAKNLLSMTAAGTTLNVNDPTVKGSRTLGRASVEQEISDKDRARIRVLLNRFLDKLVGPGSGPTATPAE